MKKEVMHFKSSKERIDYLKGKFEEIVPKEVKSVTEEPKEEKPKKKKSAKKGKKDEVQAE